MSMIKSIFYFYKDGFMNMKVGKTLWMIIGIKFFLFFIVLKLLYFPNLLNTTFSNDEEKANFVLENITHKGR